MNAYSYNFLLFWSMLWCATAIQAKNRCIGFINTLNKVVTIVAETPKQGTITWSLKPGEAQTKQIKTGAGRSNFITSLQLKVEGKTIVTESWSKDVINEWIKVRGENASCTHPIHFRVAMGASRDRFASAEVPTIYVPLNRFAEK